MSQLSENTIALQSILEAVNELPTQESIGIEDVLNRVYPVGSIYISTNATDPGSLFGGVWTRLKDRFLLAAGDTYAAGSSGGEAEHTLSVDEMPAHNHNMKYDIQGTMSTGSNTYRLRASGTAVTGSLMEATGGGLPHNNMPPYIAVYMWQRTE